MLEFEHHALHPCKAVSWPYPKPWALHWVVAPWDSPALGQSKQALCALLVIALTSLLYHRKTELGPGATLTKTLKCC